MKTTRLQFLFTLVLFAAAVAWFFLPHGNLRFTLAFPAAVLALGSVGLSPWALTAALLFCAVGDVMGILGCFPGQMAGFATAHVFFLLLLVRAVLRLRPRPSVWVPVAIGVLAALIVVACTVVPGVPGVALKVGCMVYATLLLSVCAFSLMAACVGFRTPPTASQPLTAPQPYRVSPPLAGWQAIAAAVGAAMFVFSDFVLAWNRFVERVPHAHYLIMCTYYAALLLLFLALISRHCIARKKEV